MNIEKERFEAWLMSQPGDKRFVYVDNHDCLLCRFIKETSPYAAPMVSDKVYWPKWIGEWGLGAPIPAWLCELLTAGRLSAYRAGQNPGPDGLSYCHFQTAFRAMFPETDPIIEPAKELALCQTK